MTGLCLFIQLSGIDQKGDPKTTKTGKLHNHIHPTQQPHHMITILMGEELFFNLAECQSTEKPKIEKKVVHPHPAA